MVRGEIVQAGWPRQVQRARKEKKVKKKKYPLFRAKVSLLI